MDEIEFMQCPHCKKYVEDTTTGSCLSSDYEYSFDLGTLQCKGFFFCRECLDEQYFCPDCQESLPVDIRNAIFERAGN